MTTLVVVRKGKKAVIASDSLTTFGDTRLAAAFDRSPEKIIKYKDTYVGFCGSAAHQVVFDNLLRGEPDLDFSSKAAIFETFRKLHPKLKETHYLNPKDDEEDPYESTHITSLIVNSHGIFGVYSMREVFEFAQYWAVGSGREFALGAMHAVYDNAKDAKAIAKVGIHTGCTFDKNSDLPMKLFEVNLKN